MSLFLFFCGHKSLFTNWKNFCNITISEIPSPPHQKKSKNTTTVTGVQKKTTILYFTTPKMCDVYKPIWIFQVFSKEKVPKFTKKTTYPKRQKHVFIDLEDGSQPPHIYQTSSNCQETHGSKLPRPMSGVPWRKPKPTGDHRDRRQPRGPR